MTYLKTLKDTVSMTVDLLDLLRPAPRRRARASSSRHLVLFAHALPPSSGGGVYRPLSFMRYGCKLGWRIDAFAGEPLLKQSQHGDELLALVPREATIHVVPASSREPSYRFFPRVDGGFTSAVDFAHAAISTLERNPPDVVLASGPPFFAFVAGLLAARRFGVPLVLDYRDEWTECPYDFVKKDGDDRAWESRCLRAADAVLFTTESHRRHQLATFPELDARKTHLVPNGWEPDDFQQGDRSRSLDSSDATAPVHLVHAGNLSGHTPILDFLNSLDQLITERPEMEARLRVQLIGRRSQTNDKDIRAFTFPSVLEIVDHVGKREANRRMQGADVLLLLVNKDSERYLPGKMFDYLAARRPVLAFGSPGEASDIVERLGAGVLCTPGSGDALGSALARAQRLDMSDEKESVDEWLQEHRRDVLASRAFDILDSVIARS
jgi:glycosyltransferase involved in cell wall biosynthesis